jgi:hypothetical protein
MTGMTPDETAGYLRHHLTLAGRSDPLFTEDAINLIHTSARGKPRSVNNLALAALIAAAVGYVRANGCRLATGGLDFSNNVAGLGLAVVVVDDDDVPGRRETFCDRTSDAPRCAGDDRHLTRFHVYCRPSVGLEVARPTVGGSGPGEKARPMLVTASPVWEVSAPCGGSRVSLKSLSSVERRARVSSWMRRLVPDASGQNERCENC